MSVSAQSSSDVYLYGCATEIPEKSGIARICEVGAFPLNHLIGTIRIDKSSMVPPHWKDGNLIFIDTCPMWLYVRKMRHADIVKCKLIQIKERWYLL